MRAHRNIAAHTQENIPKHQTTSTTFWFLACCVQYRFKFIILGLSRVTCFHVFTAGHMLQGRFSICYQGTHGDLIQMNQIDETMFRQATCLQNEIAQCQIVSYLIGSYGTCAKHILLIFRLISMIEILNISSCIIALRRMPKTSNMISQPWFM